MINQDKLAFLCRRAQSEMPKKDIRFTSSVKQNIKWESSSDPMCRISSGILKHNSFLSSSILILLLILLCVRCCEQIHSTC